MDEIHFIIHPSAIVRRGMVSILQEYFKTEITQLASPQELSPFSRIEGKLIIITIKEGEKLPHKLEGTLRENNKVVIIALSDGNEELPKADYYDYSLSLSSEILSIQQLIQIIRNSLTRTKITNSSLSEELTPREVDVIRKIAMGFANKEIADTLNISIHTVISHRKNITEKLNIKSISGLTVYAIMNNLLDISEISPDELI